MSQHDVRVTITRAEGHPDLIVDVLVEIADHLTPDDIRAIYHPIVSSLDRAIEAGENAEWARLTGSRRA